MNVKRIIKQVIKEECLAGNYKELFGEELESYIETHMDKIAKISLETTHIEDYLKFEAEDFIRVYLIRNEITVNATNPKTNKKS